MQTVLQPHTSVCDFDYENLSLLGILVSLNSFLYLDQSERKHLG